MACFRDGREQDQVIHTLPALVGQRIVGIALGYEDVNDKGLGTRHERWLALEQKNAEQAIELRAEQAAFLEKLNPCFKERHVESERQVSCYPPTPSWSARSA